MRIGKGVEWAVHACTLLAPLPPGKGLSLAALAQFHGLPTTYMAKQMQALSNAGIVKASRGKTGGYSLARAPAEISLWAITCAVEGSEPMFLCTEIRQQGPCASKPESYTKACPIAAAFMKAEQSYRAVLEQTALTDILVTIQRDTTKDELNQAVLWLHEHVTTLPNAD